MANKQINAYTAASTIDAVNDYFLIDPGGTGSYKKISRNTIMVVTGTPADISSTQTFTNKTIGNTNTITVKAANFTIQDGTDTTKQANFVASSITTATTRNITIPDANTTLPIATQVVTIAGPTVARTYTFPDAATTIAGIATVQTLTNKTITDSGSVLGGVTMTLGSDASGDTYYRNSSGILSRIGAGAQNTVLTMGASSVPSWVASTSQVTLLKATTGSDTSAGATNVDTFAISGLTAKDTLLVTYDFYSATQQTAGALLYENTTGTIVGYFNAGGAAITASNYLSGVATIRQSQFLNTTYACHVNDGMQTLGGQSAGNDRINVYGSHTAWTGGWTIALRHTGVTAGGTLSWGWSLFKITGQ